MKNAININTVRYTWWTVEWYESCGKTHKYLHYHWYKKSTGFFAKSLEHAKEIFNNKTGYLKDYFSGRIINVIFNN